MQDVKDISAAYPKQAQIAGGREVSLRTMGPRDKKSVLAFARSLPEDDLLFLRTDITDPAVVDAWVENVGRGTTATLLAESGGSLAGYASVHHDDTRWTRKVGEIRILVSPAFRGTGLGRILSEEIFRVSRSLGLRKLSAQMTPDQSAARAMFERLGFQVEARLADWVEDRNGRPRDLLVMTYDVTGFSDQMEEPVKV